MLRNAVGGYSAEGFEPGPSVSIFRKAYAFVSEFIEFYCSAMSSRTKKVAKFEIIKLVEEGR